MNVTIEVTDDSEGAWTPKAESIRQWLGLLLSQSGEPADVAISLRLVNEPEAAELNRTWRNKESATNVLSFPGSVPEQIRADLGYRPLGDLVVCPQVLAREARQQNKPLESHWAHLLLHGTLHLLGHHHDDESSAQAMEALEIQSLEKLGIANPYLIG